MGLLWGCSASPHLNDLWTYSLGRNEWGERITTEPSHTMDPHVLKYKDGVLMTRAERPLPSHQWGRMDYDQDRNVLWHMSGGMQSTVPASVNNLKQDFPLIGPTSGIWMSKNRSGCCSPGPSTARCRRSTRNPAASTTSTTL